MVILCGVCTKVSLDKMVDKTVLGYEPVSLQPLSARYLTDLMNTAALTLKRSFTPGFVSTFCEQLHALFGGHAKDFYAAAIAHALQINTKERTLSLDDKSVRSSAHVVFRSQNLRNHFDAFGKRLDPH
jgi:hypothetical protein